jgi:hypothetical protein
MAEPTRVPWVVAVWKVRLGPGGGMMGTHESVHVFPSQSAFLAATQAAVEAGRSGSWVKVYDGDPRPQTPDWQPGDYDLAADRVFSWGVTPPPPEDAGR